MLEKLEPRRLLDAELANNTLTITGSGSDDDILVEIQGSKLLLSMSPESFRNQYTLSSVRRIVVDCGDGSDRVTIDSLFTRNVTMLGGGGDDSLTGALGSDFIDGGEGNDSLDGGFDLGLSRDVLIGGLGVDLANYSHRTQSLKIDLDGNADDGSQGERDNVDSTIEIVIGGGSADEITSNLSVDVTLVGNGGDDVLNSSGGNDFLSGGKGRDLLNSRGGNDRLRGGPGTDTMVGGTGSDTADYSDRGEDLTINLDGLANDGAKGENDLIFADIENLSGGSGNDSITGTSSANFLNGFGGNDSIFGLGGNDNISGGAGDDSMDGGSGNDQLDGGTGADVFIGGAGTDTAGYFGRGENLVIRMDNIANDGAPRERDNVRNDNEIIQGGSGSDLIVGSGNMETLLGGLGNDSLVGGAGDDFMDGGPGNDDLDGGLGADTFIGGPGSADVANYTSRTGDLTITVDNLPDDGEAGEQDNISIQIEIVRGGSGNDFMQGGDERNTFEGRAGNDTLFGGDGNDILDGGNDDDVLDGEGKADIMIGGAGIDTADYSLRIVGEDLEITLDDMADDGNNETDNVMSDIEVVKCGAGDDEVTASDDPLKPVTVFGGDGKDTLRGGPANDVLMGEGDNDSIIGGDGNDFLFGGDGDDRFNSIDLIPDTVNGGAGNDDAINSDFVDTLIGIEIP